MRRIHATAGECIELWAALDALVLNGRLDFPKSCYQRVNALLGISAFSCVVRVSPMSLRMNAWRINTSP